MCVLPPHHTHTKQGSGFVGESTIDAVVGVTLVDYNGEIRHYHMPDPDVKARDWSMYVMLCICLEWWRSVSCV